MKLQVNLLQMDTMNKKVTMSTEEFKKIMKLAEIGEKAERVCKEANNAIYFDDNSDYIRSLWEICKILGMEDSEIGKEYLEEK